MTTAQLQELPATARAFLGVCKPTFFKKIETRRTVSTYPIEHKVEYTRLITKERLTPVQATSAINTKHGTNYASSTTNSWPKQQKVEEYILKHGFKI